MNIKSERAHELAREAARRTGWSQTRAVEEGLALLLAKHGGPATERERRLDVMRSISLAWEPVAAGHDGVSDVEDLYDAETGLPQ